MMFFNKKANKIVLISIFLMFLCLGAVCASDISTENNTNNIDDGICTENNTIVDLHYYLNDPSEEIYNLQADDFTQKLPKTTNNNTKEPISWENFFELPNLPPLPEIQFPKPFKLPKETTPFLAPSLEIPCT